MTFLNSIFLAALAAVTIPLLIHFLSRRRIKIVDFSSLKFLMTMQKSKLRWLKILELILLIIRMMIIALIALAFARPALTGRNAASHAPASIVVLVDDSPSLECLSSGGTVFDDVKRGVIEIIDMLKPGDEVTIITLSGQTENHGAYSDFPRARDIVNALQVESSPPNFHEGLTQASRILGQSHNLNREVYIFSDFQQGRWWDGDFANLINNDYRYFVLSYNGDNVENVGIDKVEFPGQLLAPGEEFELKAQIKNYSNKAMNTHLVELFIDGGKRAQTSVDLKPYGSSEIGFTIIPDQPGRHGGYFELEDDDYSPDNRFYFNFDIPRKIKVLGVADNADDARLLFNTLGRTQTGYIDFSGVNMSGFSRHNLNEYDVVILDNVPALSPGNLNSLADFVNAGKGLFIILGSKATLNSYQNFLTDKAGVRADELITASTETNQDAYFSLGNFDLTSPIFKIYASQNPEAPEIPEIHAYNYHPLHGGQSLAKIASHDVLTLSSKAKIITMGFGLDRFDSDISLHSFIVPFTIRTVEYLASTQSIAEDYFVSGQTISVNLPRQVSSSSVKLAYSAGRKLQQENNQEADFEVLEVSRGAYGAFVNIPYAGYPGLYSLVTESDTVAVFSVNHDSDESTYEKLDKDQLEDILGKNIIFVDSQSDIAETVMQAKFGFELWKYCLALALLLLIAESILVRKAR